MSKKNKPIWVPFSYPNIHTTQPKFNARIQDLPDPPRPWYRKVLSFLIGRWYLRRYRR